MGRVKAQKIVLSNHGSYLGIEKGCFAVKSNNDQTTKFPLFEERIGEVVLKSGNTVSTGALATMGFWGIDCLIMTRRGRPVAMLKSLDDDSHIQTRIAQYETFHNGKALHIAKQFVLARIRGQDLILEKHGLETHSHVLKQAIAKIEGTAIHSQRQRLTGLEGKGSQHYFQQLFQLLPENLRPKKRRKFQAYDGVNNLFNLAYEMLSWKVHRALIKAKLEAFLGFLHAAKFERPSLVCDFVELYRYLVEDFLIRHCQQYTKKDFTFKTEVVKGKRLGKRQYLNDKKTRDLMKQLDLHFEKRVEVPRIYQGKRQSIETLINEEALLFAMYLRGERREWIPRIAIP